ncbi:MAG: type VI secretion system Vgr family protein, partial [bacterium]
IDKDKITKIGNHRVDDVFANQEVTIGGHFSQTTNGEHDVRAGVHIKSATKVHTLSGSDKLVIKGNGGTIILDSSGITLKGVVQIKGSLAVLGGGAESVDVLKMRFNEGKPLCKPCVKKRK